MSKICKKKTAVVMEQGEDKGEEIVVEEDSNKTENESKEFHFD